MTDTSSHKSVPGAPSESGSARPPTAPDGAGSQGSSPPRPEGSSSRGSASSDPQRTFISGRAPDGGIGPVAAIQPLESGSLLEGERLGQFLLQKFIGGGGMGVVFRALDTTLNREVAVKVLSRDQSADDEALRRFRNEAQSAARLNHENIARVHYVGEDRGVHYIVFEFIEGTNLRDRVEQNGPLPVGEAVSYTYQIAQALDHASQRDVIHRDIKPSNVLITPDGKAKLVDMGLARLNQVAHADQDLTASGVTLGTFDYISPEQARDPRSADVRSDMYSLGCSFYYMLTGRPPFPDGTVLQKLLQHQADHPPDPRVLRPDLPIEVTWILARLLAKNPAQRFQQASMLAEQLAVLGEKLGLHLSAPPAVWAQPQPDGPLARWRHHLPWAVPLAALFLIVTALDYVWSSGSGGNVAGPRIAPARQEFPPSAAPPSAAPRSTPAPAGASPETPVGPSPNNPLPPPKRPQAEGPDTAAPSAVEADEAPPAQAGAGNSFAERVAKSFGADSNGEPFSARASPPVEKTSGLEPPPAGTLQETSVSGADSETSEPPAEKSSTRAIVPSEGLLVVSDTQTGEQVYSSLRAACDNAKTGEVIELRFDGRMLEDPITISNMNLTIRAADGFRPTIVFRPQPRPLIFTPSMFSIAGGQLRAERVHWELDLRSEVPGDSWAMFETRRAELLRFEQCDFTVRNLSVDRKAYHAGVAFFDIKAPPGGGTMTFDPAADDQAVIIELEHCVVRGEATLVRDNELQPLRLDWYNGLLAISERLLVAAGGPTEPRPSGYVQINLRHVTAMFAGGLALLTNSQDAPYQLKTEINCTDSILASMANPPLVEQRGPNDVQQYLDRVEWKGDHDFFDGFEIFWKIVDDGVQTTLAQMDFDEWRQTQGGLGQPTIKGPVGWRRLPSLDRPFHEHTPQDYALDHDSADNPAVGGASDEADAGCLIEQLDGLPRAPADADKLPGDDTSSRAPADES